MDNKDDYFNNPDFKETLQRYEQSVSNRREEYFDSDELSDIAEYYYDEGKTQEAVKVLDYAIRLHPGATMPLVFRGRIALIDEKDIDKAKLYAGQISDSYDLDSMYLQAEIMIAEDKADEANAFLHYMSDTVDEDDLPDYVLDVANMFIDYNMPDKAEEWLNMSDETDLQDYREIKARIAFAKGDYEQSEKLLNELLDEDPFSSRYWNSLASTQFMAARINDSITSSEYSIAINPNDSEALLNKANALFSLGNFDEARKFYERFCRVCPDEPSATMFIGHCLLNTGKTQEALGYYENALAIARKFGDSTVEVLQSMAFTLSQLNRPDEALACLDEAVKEKEANRDDINVVRGHIQLEHGHVKDAIKSFLTALKDTSFSHDIFFRIAISVYDCGYPAIAYRMFKSYTDVHSNPGDDGMAYLASCCQMLNRKEEYLKCLNKVCRENPLEAQKVLGENFPQGMNPKDYFDYEVERMKRSE